MPIFEFECAYGHRTQDVFVPGQRVPKSIGCQACSDEIARINPHLSEKGRAMFRRWCKKRYRMRRVVSSFIHVWADGAHIDNDMARDQREFLRSEEGRKLLREDKLVPVSELRPEYCELTQKRAARDKEFERDLSDLSAMKQAGMTPEQARERFRADKKAARTGAAKSKVVAA